MSKKFNGRNPRVRWSETIVQKDSDEAEFERVSDDAALRPAGE